MTETGVVVVGGGVLGCSVAYHLARAGARDVRLVERGELAAQTTSCSAGLVGQLRPTAAQARLVQRTLETVRELEAELGEPVGFRAVGSLRVATTAACERDLHAQLAIARAEGVEAALIDAAEARRRVPGLDARRARAIAWIPGDGVVDPHRLTMAYARAARLRGVTVSTGTAVTGLRVAGGRVTGVDTDHGAVTCRLVVVAAGAWSGPVAALAGAALPVTPVRSHFWITAPHPAIVPDQPVVRIPAIRPAYARAEIGGLLVGCYEPESLACDAWALPAGFSMRDVPRDREVFLRHVEEILPYFPCLEEAGLAWAMAGLTTYAPDGQFVLGPVPGAGGLLVASGCSGLGVTGSGGIGEALAELALTGSSALDLAPFRADRFGPVDPRSPAFRARCAAARSASHRAVPSG